MDISRPHNAARQAVRMGKGDLPFELWADGCASTMSATIYHRFRERRRRDVLSLAQKLFEKLDVLTRDHGPREMLDGASPPTLREFGAKWRVFDQTI